MKTLTSGEICGKFSAALYSAVKYGKKEAFGETVLMMNDTISREMTQGTEQLKKVRSISEASEYILKRRDAVMNMNREGSVGSAAEALVSHVLSERLSRNPMGWSKAGLAKMAQIRICTENNGKVAASDIGGDKKHKGETRTVPAYIRKYDRLVRKMQEDVLSASINWRWFECDSIPQTATSGTKVVLDAPRRLKQIA